MAAKKKRPTNVLRGVPSPATLRVAQVLILLALAASAYLAWVALAQGTVIGCGPDSGCDKVLQSRWARWFGVPVSVLALGVDGLLLGWSFGLNPGTALAFQRKAWSWIIPCALLVASAAVWFVGIQLLVLRSICPYCMAAHVSGGAAAILLLRAMPREEQPGRATELVYLPRAQLTRLMVLAGVAFAGLILGQVLYRPKTFQLTALGADTNFVANATGRVASATSAVPRMPLPSVSAESNAQIVVTQAPAPAVAALGGGRERLFPIYSGRFEIRLHEVPRSGAVTNAHVIVSMFDYTCHHCRVMHPLLLELQRTFSNRLVIANLPMPLDPSCNPALVRPNPKHTNACDYARLGLTVWRANPAKHAAFDDWLMEGGGERPPPLEEARQQAVAMVGEQAFQRATQDPWVEQQLRQDIALYQFAYSAGQGSMPQLIFASGMAVGTFSRDELFTMIANNLGLKVEP